MTQSMKKAGGQIILSALLLIGALFLPESFGLGRYILLIGSYLLVGGEVIYKAVRNLWRGQWLDEHFLMALATLGAICLGEWVEAVEVMLFYQIGEWFQDYAVERSRREIASLVNLQAEVAHVQLPKSNTIEDRSPEEVSIGDIIIVKAGEKIPLDGRIITGSTQLNTVALTGESTPRSANTGTEVLSGMINLSGLITIEVTKDYEDSALSRILELVEDAIEEKAPSERFVTKFARYYTPIVVGIALLVAFLPPLLAQAELAMWVKRALIFLVVSCPCALVVSVPLTFYSGIGSASKRGILVKGGQYLEQLANCQTLVFDKTGTLTKGNFAVVAIHPDKMDEQDMLRYVAALEAHSNHPIAQSILDEAQRQGITEDQIQQMNVDTIKEIAGFGLKGTIDGHEVLVGNERLMAQHHIKAQSCHLVGTIVHLAVDDDYIGHLIIADELKDQVAEDLATLRAAGINYMMLLTGDRQKVGEALAKDLGIQQVATELLPADKVTQLKELQTTQKGHPVAFVGDGINDAPVLATADIGIAMGAMGSDAAIEVADIVLMNDNLGQLVTAVEIARQTMRTVRQNIWLTIGVKVAVLILATFGLANMQLAIFADVGMTIIAVLNALFAIKKN